MRKIKFRAWDKKNKKMVDEIIEDVGMSWGELDLLDVDFLLEDYILLQYTGLKDKNGKEIYEGDILGRKDKRCKNGVVIHGIVEYKKNRSSDEDGEITEMTVGLVLNQWMLEGEVIGNKYENPELLE